MIFQRITLPEVMHMSGEIQDGGDYIMSMAYLDGMERTGVRTVMTPMEALGKNYQGLKAEKHIQEAQILPEKDYDQIKEMVYKYGGVESSMYMSLNSIPNQNQFIITKVRVCLLL